MVDQISQIDRRETNRTFHGFFLTFDVEQLGKISSSKSRKVTRPRFYGGGQLDFELHLR